MNIKNIANKAKWTLKQLLPLKYFSKYSMEGKRFVCSWKMFMGQSFDVEHFEIKIKRIC